MTFRTFAISCFAAIALAGCAPFEQSERRVSREQLRCDLAVAEGMASTQREAARLAEDGARQQYADSRGYLLSIGFKRIRIDGKDTRCRPHPLASSFIHCTAQVRLCGR